MQIPPGAGHNPREGQELEARFSALSAEISASLDTILARLQSTPEDEHAIAVALDLVAAQQAVMHQLLLLRQAESVPVLPAASQHSSLQHYNAHSVSLLDSMSPYNQRGWHAPTDVQRSRSYVERAPDSEEPKSLGDLLRQHLTAPAMQPVVPFPYALRPPVVQVQPLPSRPHALPLAPMEMPSGNLVWADQGLLVPAQPAEVADQPSTLLAAERGQAPRLAPAPAGLVAMSNGAALPAWAQQSAQRPSQRYGLWAGGTLAAIVIGLGIVLNAGRHPVPAPATEEQPVAAQIETAPTAQNDSDEPARPLTVQARAQEAVVKLPAAQESSTNVPEAPLPRPPSAPAMAPPAILAEPAQSALLPSAQNWLDKNAEPASSAAPVAPTVSRPVKLFETGATGAVSKPKVKPPEPTAPAAKKPEPPPFNTAVVKAPEELLFAPVLLELKNADSLMRVFQDLQGRHRVLSSMRPELRPAAGPNNETWFALLAVPAAPKAEAEAICRAIGSEGASLRCRVIKY